MKALSTRGSGVNRLSPLARREGAPAAELPRLAVPDGLGVNIHFTDPRPGELEMIAAAGTGWVRMDFGWDGTERQKGTYDPKPAYKAAKTLATVLDGFSLKERLSVGGADDYVFVFAKGSGASGLPPGAPRRRPTR